MSQCKKEKCSNSNYLERYNKETNGTTCHEICPLGFYKDELSCQKCPADCKSCIENSEKACTTCKSGELKMWNEVLLVGECGTSVLV